VSTFEITNRTSYLIFQLLQICRGRRGRERMVVGFTTNCATKGVSSNPVHGKLYSIQHYVIKFVSGLRQVDGFLRVLRFPPLIKLTAMI